MKTKEDELHHDKHLRNRNHHGRVHHPGGLDCCCMGVRPDFTQVRRPGRRLCCKSGGAGEVGDPTALTERGENVTESESVDETGHPTM